MYNVQGMSYVASVLLLYLHELPAFICMANLLDRGSDEGTNFFTLDKQALDNYVTCFDYFLKRVCGGYINYHMHLPPV